MTTALALPPTPRLPDGVPLDPSALVPHATVRAPAAGVVSLKPALGGEVLRRAVQAFFDVFADRDADALDALLSRAARLLDAHGGSSYATLREELRSRIRAFDAAGADAVRVQSIERFDYLDLQGDPAEKPPAEMRPGDVLVRVHVVVPGSGGARLFAPVVVLLWRWEEDLDARDKKELRVVGYDEIDSPALGSYAGSP